MIASLPRPDASPARIAPLARLPVFLALEDKRALVCGGTPAAAWKVELLSAAGASVEVYAPEPCEELVALAAEAPRGAIAIHRRAPDDADFAGVAIAVGAMEDDVAAARFRAQARARGVPVNVIDRPAFCDFAFGAIVNRSPLVIGISTAGAAPVFAQAVRTRIELLIPRGFAGWVQAAREWRARVEQTALSFRARQQFWQKFTARALASPNRVPGENDFSAAQADAGTTSNGSIVTINVGDGDPDSLRLREVRALQSADIIVFDRQVGAGVLDYARREARKLLVDQSGRDDPATLMAALAKAGRRVVRLTGDASVAAGNIMATTSVEAKSA